MRILVMGSGGVGGYFGGRLQQGGADVTFVARGRHLAAMQKDGLRITSPHGDAQLRVKAVEQPADAGAVDLVMFGVKLWDTDGACGQLGPIMAKGAAIIPFQNGVESIERLRGFFPKEQVLGGSAYIASRISAPGTIEHIGQMARLQFGTLMDSQRPVAERFLEACKAGKLNAEISDDIVRSNWEKFVFLVALSTATAASRQPLGVVRADADLRWVLEQAMRETWSVGRARGIKLADDFVEKSLQRADALPAEMKASMAHDLDAGHRLEAPWLCGAVARMGRESGVPTPVNATVYAALKPFVDGSARKAS
ncbi:MAG TPA: 2-dehydropantoate 2-reductase [Burkholderiales bacterium]|nr:2-dehydropantoate 2-reductase [Burkholderiales bacterium]